MKILCYGDSNTFGFDPRGYFGDRYGTEDRWPEVLGDLSGWSVNNQGMNGRAIPRVPARFPATIDAVLVMLGTNDLLRGKSAEETAVRMEKFITSLDIALDKLIIVAPPKMQRGEWVSTDALIHESAALGEVYGNLCEKLGVRFVDATAWEISMCYDGVHFTEEGNRQFARNMYCALKEAF